MSGTDVLARVKEKLGGIALGVQWEQGNQAFITVPVERNVEACGIVHKDMGARFATCTGIDTRDAIEVLYHFCFDGDGYAVTLKTAAAKPFAQLETITGVIPAAEWIEREMMDLLEVKFRNHPRPERLILSDDWPEGEHPLRRGFRNGS